MCFSYLRHFYGSAISLQNSNMIMQIEKEKKMSRFIGFIEIDDISFILSPLFLLQFL